MDIENLQIQVKTFFGLEQILAVEIKKLGGKNVEIKNRAVTCEGDLGFLYKLNYSCRTAVKIIIPIMEFKAYNTDPITLFSVKEFERFAFDQRNLRLFSSCIADIFKAGPASSIPKTGEFDLDPF